MRARELAVTLTERTGRHGGILPLTKDQRIHRTTLGDRPAQRPWCKLRRASRAWKDAARLLPRMTFVEPSRELQQACRRDAWQFSRQLGCRAGHQPADSFTPKLGGDLTVTKPNFDRIANSKGYVRRDMLISGVACSYIASNVDGLLGRIAYEPRHKKLTEPVP